MKTTTITIAITVLMGLSGCANARLSQRKLAQTQAAIDAAARNESATNPHVALHLEYAKDQVVRAKELMSRHKEHEAQRMLDRAQADADLALALAESARSHQQAHDAWNEVKELEQHAKERTGDMSNGGQKQGMQQMHKAPQGQ